MDNIIIERMAGKFKNRRRTDTELETADIYAVDVIMYLMNDIQHPYLDSEDIS
jgi:hypothetical protein